MSCRVSVGWAGSALGARGCACDGDFWPCCRWARWWPPWPPGWHRRAGPAPRRRATATWTRAARPGSARRSRSTWSSSATSATRSASAASWPACPAGTSRWSARGSTTGSPSASASATATTTTSPTPAPATSGSSSRTLSRLAEPAPLTEFQQAYNDQENNVLEVAGNHHIDAPTVERWLADHPPAGVDTRQQHDLLRQLVRAAGLQVPRLHQDRRARPGHRLQLRRRDRHPQADRLGRHHPRRRGERARQAAPGVVLRPVGRARGLDRQLERRRRRPRRRRRGRLPHAADLGVHRAASGRRRPCPATWPRWPATSGSTSCSPARRSTRPT